VGKGRGHSSPSPSLLKGESRETRKKRGGDDLSISFMLLTQKKKRGTTKTGDCGRKLWLRQREEERKMARKGRKLMLTFLRSGGERHKKKVFFGLSIICAR